MTQQFGRACTLYLSDGNKALDLSQFRIQFHTTSSDIQTPNQAYIRIYNLARETMQGIIDEYVSVVLQAGYQGSIGDIFKGTIIRFKRGKESNVDSYLDILAADGDEGYNFGVISQSFAAGSHVRAQIDALAAQMGLSVDSSVYSTLESPTAATGGIVLPRGRVLWGMARYHLSNIAAACNARWSIQNGVLTFVPLTGYLPGEAVVVNSQTGMIGIPESTEEGIKVKTLLNPLYKIGTRIQLAEKDVTAYPGLNGAGYLSKIDPNLFGKGNLPPFFPASVTSDGFYRVMAIEHDGDTRGMPWYSELVCLAVDPSAAPNNSVKAF